MKRATAGFVRRAIVRRQERDDLGQGREEKVGEEEG
jgi:hypothetical protein